MNLIPMTDWNEIKIEFLLGSSHNCMIEIIVSECIIDSYKRISYYSSLEEKHDGFVSPNGSGFMSTLII